MLKSLLRVVAAVTVVVAALLSYIQLSFVEQDFPLGTQHRGTILFGESGLSREQVLSGLAEVSRQHDLEIYLEVPGKDDPFHGLDVYAVGHEQPTAPMEVDWLSLTRHGSLHPASELGETNLSAVYMVKGSWQGVQALTQWAESVGTQASDWGFESPLTMFAAGLVYGAAGIPLVALAVLWVTIVLAWYAARAEARAVRLLAGTPRWRIQAQDMLGWLRVVVPVLLAGVVLATVGVGLARGWGNGLGVGVIVAGYLMLMLGLAMAFGIVASMVTAPSVTSLALRKPPEARFEFPSQLLKAVALALGLAALPALLWQAQSSLAEAATQGRVAALTGYVYQRVGGVTEEELDAAYDKLDRFIQAVDATDTLAYAEILTRDEAPPELVAAGFDSVAVVNSHYVARFGLQVADGSLEPLPAAQTGELLAALEETRSGVVNGRVRDDLASAVDNGLQGYRVTSGEGLVAPSGTGLGFRHAKRPLLLISERISTSLNTDALVSALTLGHVLFNDTAVIDEQARDAGVSQMLLSRSRATDSALLAAQFANQVVFTVGSSIVILVGAIVVSGWLSARVYAANNARFIYPMLTFGRSWWVVLKRRILAEAVIITTTFTVVSIVYLALGMPWSLVLLLGMVLYLGYSTLCHQRAVMAMVHRVTQRAH
ncbi:hypothetical protein EII34_03360 [Arachnia propionica]|uniref:Uncharacterized protein n=1 Tax=Arachnia propionica TaxID=1750 RepID=A0A3P1TCR3_9ACTN|nr:hypothetical protein [Arachnia propionica]RRD06676.1 hypothetical protein EII34_03360 [Arachnia propionica]